MFSNHLKHGLVAGAFAVVVSLVALPGHAVDWNHDPDSDIGPPRWGQLDPSFLTCETGRQQSPVDISRPVPGGSPALVFNYEDSPFEVENNGHVIEVPYELGSTLRVGRDVYTLLQFHFHAPSEHTVRQASYDMEVHLVHRKGEQLAVVGILLKVGKNPNRLIDAIIANAPEEEGTVTVRRPAAINALDLLPDQRDRHFAPHAPTVVNSYYTYPGSLTTPPCSEGVRWFVLREPVHVSQQAVDRLHELIARFPHYDGYPNNNRPVQPLNDRRILLHRGR